MFALVVTHSCEIDRQKNLDTAADHFDCRLTVAPIVPEPAVHLVGPAGNDQTVNRSAIEANQPVGSLFLPPIPDVSLLAQGVDALPWPRSFADLRRLARHELVEALIGRCVVDAIPLNAKGDRLRVALTADDGSSVTVELHAK